MKKLLVCFQAPQQMTLLENEMIQLRIRAKQNNQLCQAQNINLHKVYFTFIFIDRTWQMSSKSILYAIYFNCLWCQKVKWKSLLDSSNDMNVTLGMHEKRISVHTSHYVYYRKHNLCVICNVIPVLFFPIRKLFQNVNTYKLHAQVGWASVNQKVNFMNSTRNEPTQHINLRQNCWFDYIKERKLVEIDRFDGCICLSWLNC